ncbi:MAG: hypothetical protein ACI970_001590, partial [Myxococcota bacterium]
MTGVQPAARTMATSAVKRLTAMGTPRLRFVESVTGQLG